MKFFIKRSNKEPKMKQLDSSLNLTVENVRLVNGGSGSGDGAQPKMQRFSLETKLVSFGG
ncbi:hypothetical protein [Pseudoalteromonas rubra]|uniref:hypothetical protein n=1 Tax=Pseudoalteromonas rubra TaxID=43658 RepID=UPI002DBB9F2F|nr:hypothetical protein [Pseudoalteromonas rubra]MEC4089544.1 hypothetical protein [Pseudoalteromonas rubra]